MHFKTNCKAHLIVSSGNKTYLMSMFNLRLLYLVLINIQKNAFAAIKTQNVSILCSKLTIWGQFFNTFCSYSCEFVMTVIDETEFDSSYNLAVSKKSNSCKIVIIKIISAVNSTSTFVKSLQQQQQHQRKRRSFLYM
jgi:hypothetical protein